MPFLCTVYVLFDKEQREDSCSMAQEISRDRSSITPRRYASLPPSFPCFLPWARKIRSSLSARKKKKYPLRLTEDKIDSILPWFSTSQRRLSHKSIIACRFSLKTTRLLRVIRLRLSLISFTHLDSILIIYLTILSFNFQGYEYFYPHLVVLFYCDNNRECLYIYRYNYYLS